MGIISRYFGRLAARIRPTRAAFPAIAVNDGGLRIGGEWVAWSDVRRLDAYKRDIYAGDLLCLVILTSSGRMFEINEESPGWNDAAAIERNLPGSVPHVMWKLRLIAADPGEAVVIYPDIKSG